MRLKKVGVGVTAVLVTVLGGVTAADAANGPTAGGMAGAAEFSPAYLGYGSGTEIFKLHPTVSTRPSQTHASLMLTPRRYKDINFTVTLDTTRQLRQGSRPNPWEVGWVLWDYTNDSHFYYIALKPDGFELGKEDPAYPGDQRYLVTRSSPKFPVGKPYKVRIVTRGATMTVYVDGTKLVRYTDTKNPYTGGKLGLYCEDSAVTFQMALGGD
jgi:hypothetical protein